MISAISSRVLTGITSILGRQKRATVVVMPPFRATGIASRPKAKPVLSGFREVAHQHRFPQPSKLV